MVTSTAGGRYFSIRGPLAAFLPLLMCFSPVVTMDTKDATRHMGEPYSSKTSILLSTRTGWDTGHSQATPARPCSDWTDQGEREKRGSEAAAEETLWNQRRQVKGGEGGRSTIRGEGPTLREDGQSWTLCGTVDRGPINWVRSLPWGRGKLWGDLNQVPQMDLSEVARLF